MCFIKIFFLSFVVLATVSGCGISRPCLKWETREVSTGQCPSYMKYCSVSTTVTQPFISGGNNLEDGNDCGLAGAGDLVNTDPLLGPFQDNGGPTPTLALLKSSPAIDAGANNVCARVITDQRGVVRTLDGNSDGNAICDIGAVEYDGAAPPPSITVQNTGGGGCTLHNGKTSDPLLPLLILIFFVAIVWRSKVKRETGKSSLAAGRVK